MYLTHLYFVLFLLQAFGGNSIFRKIYRVIYDIVKSVVVSI